MSAILHTLRCPIRARWRRYRNHQPFWRDDKTAAMLSIHLYGCRRCGRGAIKQRDQYAALFAARDTLVAEELREAAIDYNGDDARVKGWLRRRADKIDGGVSDEARTDEA